MDVFTAAELEYLRGNQLLARLATVGRDGMPHLSPVGWSLRPDGRTIEIGGHNFGGSKKFRDVQRTGLAALVVDDVLPPWRPRGVEIRGRAEAVSGGRVVIRIHPQRIVSWGLTPADTVEASYHARDVEETTNA
ncbi:MAG: PPOX class F420-dependent oxidoreductase [Streptosporangiales bacterium]|nr:PPOX class F420-dependent oxidoreductase [Streptosporangiales bacterium]